MGLYMVQPYEPGKIPVLMVHGLWSSPMTWMEMFNDLRSSPGDPRPLSVLVLPLSDGQPFWISAAQLRSDLAEVRAVAGSRASASRPWTRWCWSATAWAGWCRGLQTLDSGDDYWKHVSDQPFDARQGRARGPRALASMLLLPAESVGPPGGHDRHAAPRQQFLQPDDAVARRQADPAADRCSIQSQEALFRDNKDLFRDNRCCRSRPASTRSRPSRRLPGDAGQPAAAVGDVPQHHRRGARSRDCWASWPPAATAWSATRAPTWTTSSQRVDRSGRPHHGPRPSAGRARSPADSPGAPRRTPRHSRRPSPGRANGRSASVVSTPAWPFKRGDLSPLFCVADSQRDSGCHGRLVRPCFRMADKRSLRPVPQSPRDSIDRAGGRIGDGMPVNERKAAINRRTRALVSVSNQQGESPCRSWV